MTLSAARLWLIVGLIILSTGLFVIGSVIERNQGAGAHPEAEEMPGMHEGAGSHPESVWGIGTDSPWLVGAVVLVWLVLTVALLRYGQRALPVIILAAVLAIIWDVREVMAQVSNSNTSITTIASAVALTHATVAIMAGLTLWHSGASARSAGPN
jgi:hypothetical protein